MKIRISLDFLKPRLINILLTLIVLSLPIIWEKTPLPMGGNAVAAYRPVFLLAAYLQMNDYYPFFQMVGFSLAIYFAVSVVVVIASRLLRLLKKKVK
jgi:hypothetical protein